MKYIKEFKNILYLDWNIFILLKDNKELFDLLQLKNYNIVYSPAHIEDLVNSITKRNVNERIIEKDLDFISKITKNKEFYPNHGDMKCKKAVCLVEESPKECYYRVMKFYDKTKLAEDLNKQVMEDAKKENYQNYDTNRINNIPINEVFKEIFSNIITKQQFVYEYNIYVVNHKLEYPHLSDKISILKNEDFKIIKFNTNFFNLLIIIEMLVNLLDKIGFWKDKAENAHNRMNDITHIIYGIFSDKFITADKGMFQRTKAIYKFLGIDNEILYFDQNTKMLKKMLK